MSLRALAMLGVARSVVFTVVWVAFRAGAQSRSEARLDAAAMRGEVKHCESPRRRAPAFAWSKHPGLAEPCFRGQDYLVACVCPSYVCGLL